MLERLGYLHQFIYVLDLCVVWQRLLNPGYTYNKIMRGKSGVGNDYKLEFKSDSLYSIIHLH